jgi:hypothetical protein
MNAEDMRRTVVLRKRLSEEQIRAEKRFVAYVVGVVCVISISLAVGFSTAHFFR